RRPDRLRRFRGGAPFRRPGDRRRATREIGMVAAGPQCRAPMARATRGATAAGGERVNYGVIGNCQVAALVDEQARLVWACLPRPDGDPVFSALLQKEGGASTKGVFAVDMVDLTRTEQSYMRNSAIIETKMFD